ncbi:hypothetical protein SDC9_140161 [bioreactor metagenome]|uniref:Uncharacterized protein n=1 Tax=bioreactor metagenome TaxID=1076179 RepID=A0A645DUR4_9ZZZZ
MISINNLLIVHRGVDRGDGTRLNAVSIIQQFNDGYYAIRGAGGIGNDPVLSAQLILINAKHNGCVDVVTTRM